MPHFARKTGASSDFGDDLVQKVAGGFQLGAAGIVARVHLDEQRAVKPRVFQPPQALFKIEYALPREADLSAFVHVGNVNVRDAALHVLYIHRIGIARKARLLYVEHALQGRDARPYLRKDARLVVQRPMHVFEAGFHALRAADGLYLFKIGGELARLTERKEVMLKEYDDVIRQLYDEYQLTRSEAESMGIRIEKPSDAKRELADVKSKIRSLGNVNVSAIEEYKEVSERYEFMSAQINDVETTRAELHKLINQLTHQMQDIFTEGFEKINENFSKTFTELFGGGSASLTLSEPENVLESGIDINVKLPGKNVPSLDGLSGGEKALIALSIYFAIMRVNAPPFCFLDEVDTALDDINVERFADYMKKSDYSTQFICVTHRRGTMEAADMLYGVTMQEKGITKLLELNVSELEKTLAETKGA